VVAALLHHRTGVVDVDEVVGTRNLPQTVDYCTPRYHRRTAALRCNTD
jgi:hypothetical protein